MGQIDDAVAYLKAQDVPNYAAAARLYGVQPTTLRRRFLGLATFRPVASSEHHQLLNIAQEEVLLGYIDKMTAKFMPPTTQIIRNLAEELIDGLRRFGCIDGDNFRRHPASNHGFGKLGFICKIENIFFRDDTDDLLVSFERLAD